MIGHTRGLGIPAPTGSYEVGCVDLMHRLEGDSDGLLIRLFYPTDPGLARRYQYAKTTPHPNYLKGALEFVRAIQGLGPITKALPVVGKYHRKIIMVVHCKNIATFSPFTLMD